MKYRVGCWTKRLGMSFLVWFASVGALQAQVQGESSLEDLLNIEIVTASKFSEPLWEAPGVVSVITAKELEQFGGEDLWEVLARVPGLQPLYNVQVAENIVSIRGDLPTVSDNHVLLLVNGRAAVSRHSWDGGANGIVYSSFPLSMIERIEIVRGPGSVLYGTNAFTGVINIITKDPDDSDLQFSVNTGSFNSVGAELFSAFEKGDLELNLGLRYFEEDGWDYDLNILSGSFEHKADSRSVGLFADVKYKDLTLTAFLAQSEYFMLSSSRREIHYDNPFLDLGYKRELNDQWELSFNLSYSGFRYDVLTFPDTRNTERLVSDDYLGEITGIGKISDDLTVLVGGVANRLTGDTPPPVVIIDEAWKILWYSFYGQVEYRFTEAVKGIAGGQYNNADDVDDFVPRFGAIVNFSEDVGVKLLHAEAFRSPYAAERLINAGFIQGGDLTGQNLVPQTVATTDIQFFVDKTRFQASLTYFNSAQENLIVVTPFESPDKPNVVVTLGNVNSVDSSGFEFESKFVPADRWYGVLSYSYQKNENGFGVKDVTLAPDSMVKAGVSYSGDMFSFSLFDNYRDKYKPNSINNPGALQLNPASESVHNVTLHMKAELSDLDFTFSNLSFELHASNLLDEEIWVPEVFTSPINTIPGGPGRAIQGVLKLRY